MEFYYFVPLFVCLLFHYRYILTGKKKKKNLPPSPPSLPFIGHLHLLKKPPFYKTLAKLAEQHGPVLYLHIGCRPVLVVSSPAVVKDCLTKSNDIIFANRPRLLIGKILGNNFTTIPWAPYGPNWRNLRRISAIEILSSIRVKSFGEPRSDEVRSLIKRLHSPDNEYQTVELKSMFYDLTFKNMMLMIAGKGHIEKFEEATQLQDMLKESVSLNGGSILDFIPVLKWLGAKGFENKLLNLKGRMEECLQKLIQRKRKLRRTCSNNNVKDENETLIEVLLRLQENEPEYYTDEMIRGFIWALFGAGTETSSSTMQWAMSFLLNHPEIMNRAQREIDSVVQQGRLIHESDLSKLPYLHNIINETLRICPVVPLLVPHESSEDCIVSGYDIPRHTMLFVNVWAIQNDPNIWIEPTKFKPERFDGLEGTRDVFKWMPFGSGRRGCPGEGLAMHVVGLTLGALIQCFNWQRLGEEMVDMSQGLGATVQKLQPLEARCKIRSSALNLVSQF